MNYCRLFLPWKSWCIYEKAHHFVPLRIPLRERKTIKITEYIKEMAWKNAVFPYFLSWKKRKAAFSESHNPKVVSSNLAPATRNSYLKDNWEQEKHVVSVLYRGCVLFYWCFRNIWNGSFFEKNWIWPQFDPKTSKKEWSRIFCPVPFFLFTNWSLL